jgi:hypothetical protein
LHKECGYLWGFTSWRSFLLQICALLSLFKLALISVMHVFGHTNIYIYKYNEIEQEIDRNKFIGGARSFYYSRIVQFMFQFWYVVKGHDEKNDKFIFQLRFLMFASFFFSK